MPAEISRSFPGNPIYCVTAALQVVQADCTREVGKEADPTKAQDFRRHRLMKFAMEYAATPESPKAVMEAAQICEALKNTDDARQCYRYLAKHYAGQSVARKAEGALWRMGGDGETVHLALPLLYAADNKVDQPFDLDELHGKVVVVYFWSRTLPRRLKIFRAWKQLTDRYQFRGLETVYVNLDQDPAAARDFLSGRLTAGVHVFERGGLEGPIAERFGIQTLPQTFLIDKDGKPGAALSGGLAA